VRVVEFVLSAQMDGAWHRHSQLAEYCYCLKGRLAVEIEGGKNVILGPGINARSPRESVIAFATRIIRTADSSSFKESASMISSSRIEIAIKPMISAQRGAAR
jgi:hypothetical protein